MAKKLKRLGGTSISSLGKEFPGSGIANEVLIPPEDALWLPTQSLIFNDILGGGTQYGKIIEIHGSESSGKSLLSLDYSFSAQKLGGWVIWVDAEQSLTAKWAQTNKIDLEKMLVYNETSIEKISDYLAKAIPTLRAKLVNNEPILVVIDSMAALNCEANLESSQLDQKAEMGNRAKAIGNFLRLRTPLIAETGVVMILINQLRSKIGASLFEDPDTTTGGKSIQFFASQRLGMYRLKQIKAGDKSDSEVIGNNISVRVKKNKLAPPKASFQTEVYFNEEYHTVGFDKYQGFLDILLRAGIVTKTGNSIIYNGENIGLSEKKFYQNIARDSKLRRNLIGDSGVKTISQVMKQLETLKNKGINLYPIILKKNDNEGE